MRQWAPPPDKAPIVGLLVAVAFLAGGVTAVQSATATRADRAAAAAISAEAARQDRIWAAGEARLTGLVTADAAHHRTVALDAAASALAAADATLADAAVDVATDARDSLVAATARLQALVERVPDAASVLGAPAPATDAGSPAIAGDDVTVVEAPAAAASPTSVPASPAAETVAPAAETVATAATGPVPSGYVVSDAPVAGGVEAAGLADGSRTALEALDAGTSDQLLTIAAEVTELVAQVRLATEQAAAAAQAAALEAAQAAEAARVAAEQSAALDLAHKIAAADAAPNGDIPSSVLCGVSFDAKVLLRCDAAAALERLNAAFRDHFGYAMSVSDSYRDYDGQVLARQNRGDLAATPGTSNHGRGLAIDLNGYGELGQFDKPYFVWMSDHAGDFGWVHPSYMNPGGSGPLEPWHWEYGTQ